MALKPYRDIARGAVFRRVLVGYDGSGDAQRALQVAISLAGDLGCDPLVLLVVRPPAHAETAEEQARAAQAEQENLSRGLEGIQDQTLRHVEISTVVLHAENPAAAIAGYAEEHGFDLIVVGGHGREHMTHRGIGHSLESLLRHHPCPLVVV